MAENDAEPRLENDADPHGLNEPEGTPKVQPERSDGNTDHDVAPDHEPGGKLLRGATVSPGLVLGHAHRSDYDLERVGSDRVALDEVDLELNRFRHALDESRKQIADLRQRLKGRVPDEDARILDTHTTYLSDSVFIADVENLILNEQMRLDAAIAKVVGDFDRIFRLVQSESLRQSAVDLRDVGIRVLRNIERDSDSAPETPEVGRGDYILVAKELSIVDMFNLSSEHVKGIVTESGGLTSHAATFARSMRIPTVTGVENVLDIIEEGDFVIVDAAEGIVRVNPDEVVREQYARPEVDSAEAKGDAIARQVPDWARGPSETSDGEEVAVAASAGNLPEVEQAREYARDAIGLYRTELLYLIDRTPPSREALVQHYTSVVGAAQDAPVTFRLLNVDSSVGIPYLHSGPERNPSLGLVGVRALLANPTILRRQLQAILLAGRGADVRVAVPFVTDCGDLRRVKEILFEERLELRKQGEDVNDSVPIGVVIETPTSMLGIRDLALEADFLMLNLDSLHQHLLASDRENASQASAFKSVHPFVMRALTKAAEVARSEARPLWVFGAMVTTSDNLPFLIGAGLRHFCVPPVDLEAFLGVLRATDSKAVETAAASATKSGCFEESEALVAGFRHGYAPD